MTNQTTPAQPAPSWRHQQVHAMAAVCLATGVLAGYLLRGSSTSPALTPSASVAESGGMANAAPMPTPSLDQLKHMADKKAEPLLGKLAKDPKNVTLLSQVGQIYKATHQFQRAAEYYGKAVEADPKNVAVRTEMASCLYYSGDIEGALGQLQQSLKYDPKDANSLFNLGMIKWKGKDDPAGAIAAWQQLLRTNQNLEKKPIVEKMIAEAQQQTRGH